MSAVRLRRIARRQRLLVPFTATTSTLQQTTISTKVFSTMSPKQPTKRESPGSQDRGNHSAKRIKREDSDPLETPHPFAQTAEENGIVLRKYYPPEMSTHRAHAYGLGQLERPIETLTAALESTGKARQKVEVKDAVVHWFKTDLRVMDNHALFMASEKANKAGAPLIGMYIVSPQDFEAHLRSPARVDFIFRTLEALREDLAKLDIPLYVETVEKRKDVPGRILELLKKWGANHVFANIEYEVDELRREADLVKTLLDQGIAMEALHDTCVVPPGSLQTGTGKQYAVYTPWFKSWQRYIDENEELMECFQRPGKNPKGARRRFAELFSRDMPSIPVRKELGDDEKERFRNLWPAGEHEAMKRLVRFAGEDGGGEMVREYDSTRDIPSLASTSSLSPYLAVGSISARTCVSHVRRRNMANGTRTWMSEVAWRDFYRHVMVNWPYVCMNKPFKPEYANIEWSYDQDHFKAWCEGRTGFPIVDAGLRQLKHMGWMHNRLRMIVACFLAKDLLLDWRMGERYFMEHLIDGDFASNNGGWGFSASVGVDPQPYFRIFNPLRQSEQKDSEGKYIREWVPELRGLGNKQIHDPYNRGAAQEAKRAGYPKPIVDHAKCRQRALAAYKEGLSLDL